MLRALAVLGLLLCACSELPDKDDLTGCAPDDPPLTAPACDPCSPCELPFAQARCQAGACVIERCLPGRLDANGEAADGCEAIVPPPERCDGADDDGDGRIDEGFAVGAPCAEGSGACQAHGEWMCDGDGVRCSAVASPPLATSDATCDLVDDDCDGELDEDPPCNGTACSALGGVPPGYVCIPPGTFRMGSPADEPDRDADEQQHAVTLTRPIIMARTELTQDQWLALPGWQNPALAADAGDRPVERVNVFDAMRWLNARSEHDGLLPCYGLVDCDGFADGGCPLDVEGYAQSSCHGDACADVTFFEGCDGWRLPTEAEWEHAIRAGTTTAYWCGADAGCVDDAEWHGGNVPWGPGASIVATRAANPWGLHDMGGNVQEWVFDHYHEAYGSTPATDPVYRGAAVAGFTGAVIRGTAFGFPFYWARSAQRAPEYETWRDYYIGFRPVRTLRP